MKNCTHIACCVVAALAAPCAASFPPPQQVVGKGQLLPTAAGPSALDGLLGQSAYAALMNDGTVAFGGGVRDGGGALVSGFWVASQGSFEALAVSGEDAAGLPGYINRWDGFISAPRGRGNTFGVSVDVVAAGGGPHLRGAWSFSGGQQVLLGGPQQPAPALGPGVNHYAFAVPTPTASGSVLVTGTITGAGVTPENNRVLWSFTGASPRVVARAGSQAAGMPVCVEYDVLNGLTASSAGDAFFQGEVRNVPSGRTHAAWRETGSGVELVYQQRGTLAPGYSDGTVFSSFPPGFSRSGTWGIMANNLEGPTISPSNARGVWAWNDGQYQEVLRQGEPISPLMPGSRTLGNIDIGSSNSRVTDWGFMSLSAPTVDASNTVHDSFLIGTAEGFRVAYDIGDQAPGLPAGVTIAGAFASQMNNQGHIVKSVQLAGTGVLPHNNLALYYIGPSGEMAPIARTGDIMEYEPGLFAAITALPGTTHWASFPVLNDEGDVLFAA